MNVFQKTITLKPYPRGCHLITKDIERALKGLAIRVGLCHVFLKHTSAGLTINENADPSVRVDLEEYLSRAAPENSPYFTHDYEGPDDMPAHIKSSLFGCSVTVPLRGGQLDLGTWQGIYLGEYRNSGGPRVLTITCLGDEK